MSFEAPTWLAAGLLLALAGGLGFRAAAQRRRRDLERFVSGPLLESLTATASPGRRRGKAVLFVAAAVLVCVALARPTLGVRFEEIHARGTDVVFAVDVSRSMLADDVKPDRLTRAKLAVTDLVRRLPDDRVGLVAFAGTAFLQAPLTLDHAAFQEALDALDPSVIPRGGSDLGAALHEAEAAFGEDRTGDRIVVLVTDGEDLEGNGRNAAAEAAQRGVTLYTVGVGTPGGSVVPLDTGPRPGLVRDRDGSPVLSRLDEEVLRDMARATGGFHVALGARGEGLEELHARALAGAERSAIASRGRRVPLERFQWPLGLALALLVVEALLSERRRARAARPARSAAGAAGAEVTGALALGVALAAGGVLLAPAPAGASPSEAAEAHARGAYEDALARYRELAEETPGDGRLHFNAGVSAYRAGRFEDAAEAFRRALDTGDVALQQRSYYDLGNTEVRRSESLGAPDERRAALEQAVRAYDGALALDPGDEDARHNRALAQQRLEALAQAEPPPSDGGAGDPEQGAGESAGEGQGDGESGAGKQEDGAQQGRPEGGEGSPQSGEQPGEQPGQGGAADAGPRSGEPSDGGPPGETPAPESEPTPGSPEDPERPGGADEAADGTGRDGAGRAPEDDTDATDGPGDGGAPPARSEAGPPGDPARGAGPDRDAPEAGSAAGPLAADDEAAEGAAPGRAAAQPERADGAAEGPVPGGRAAPGATARGMSAADARALLDSLRDEEVRVSHGAARGARSEGQPEGPVRDW